ncbi:lanC-like protein 3 homolog [Hydractinia symbiolongicarpus]|uniref:lanC-like protein 3 homolog n=1 Tax=Hydractinia symbiolongicarpus TaxID=13093 RepID=UPI0025504746|nr:lanC-like protein 3 homolog [Hydractinia symbiolongicarpus]
MKSSQSPGRYFKNDMSDEENKNNDPGSSLGYQKDYISDLLKTVHCNCPPLAENCEGAVYVGWAGIAYAFYYVAQSGLFEDKKDHFLKIAEKYIKVSLIEINKRDPARKSRGASLLHGHSGVYLVASLIYQALGVHNLEDENIQSFLGMRKYCKYGLNEIFGGCAGYLAACFMINKRFGRDIAGSDVTLPLCEDVINCGREMSKKYDFESPLMYSHHEKPYLGAGHGSSAILLMLLNFPACYALQPDVEKDIKLSVDFILKCQETDGNYPSRPGHTRSDENKLIQWCHGAPGVVYVMAKAYLVWKEEKYLQAALRCGEVIWTKGLLRKGPGLCHGVAGNGYAFLLLYHITHDNKHLRRAHRFAQFMQSSEFKENSNLPDFPYSLFEGYAGTACFLADIASPADGCVGIFPFMDMF